MRCVACNKRLNDTELTLKSPETGQHADLCSDCYRVSFIDYDNYDDDPQTDDGYVHDMLAQQGAFTFSGWDYE